MKNIIYSPVRNWNGRTYLNLTVVSTDRTTEENNNFENDFNFDFSGMVMTTVVPVLVSSVQDPPSIILSSHTMVRFNYYSLFAIYCYIFCIYSFVFYFTFHLYPFFFLFNFLVFIFYFNLIFFIFYYLFFQHCSGCSKVVPHN